MYRSRYLRLHEFRGLAVFPEGHLGPIPLHDSPRPVPTLPKSNYCTHHLADFCLSCDAHRLATLLGEIEAIADWGRVEQSGRCPTLDEKRS